MLLAFDTKSLRDICEDENQAKAELGVNAAGTLKRRLADLEAATLIKDILVGNPRVIPGTKSQEMIIDLTDGKQIILAANHPKNPRMADENIDWSKVTRVKILRIETIHG